MAIALITLTALSLIASVYGLIRQYKLEQKNAMLQASIEDLAQKLNETKDVDAQEEMHDALDRIEINLGRLIRRVNKVLPRKKPKKGEVVKLELVKGKSESPREEAPPPTSS